MQKGDSMGTLPGKNEGKGSHGVVPCLIECETAIVREPARAKARFGAGSGMRRSVWLRVRAAPGFTAKTGANSEIEPNYYILY